MSIFAKKIGNFLNIVFRGKPKTIEVANETEMSELTTLVKKASSGEEEATKELESKVFKNQEMQEVNLIEEGLKQKEEEISQIEGLISLEEKYDKYLNKDIFFIEDTDDGSKRVFLKPFLKAEVPPVLVEKIIHKIANNQSIEGLLNFWKLALLNENAAARKGLYNFIMKQNLFVTREGYFVTFRRVVKVEGSRVTGNNQEILKLVSAEELASLNKRAREMKKGRKALNVIKGEGNSISLTSIKTKKPKGRVLGTLSHVNDVLALNNNSKESVYTDGYTKSMVIRIGEPVVISRSLCNKDGSIECSRGLHVGSQSYVKSNSGFGDTIVVCLINPQHVVSVPYSDAHKMRVCEYLPIFKISEEELQNFRYSEDRFEHYARAYKYFESKKFKKALNLFEQLTAEERETLSLRGENLSKNLEAAKLELKESREKYNKKKKEIEMIINDDISTILDLNEVRDILRSRVK